MTLELHICDAFPAALLLTSRTLKGQYLKAAELEQTMRRTPER